MAISFRPTRRSFSQYCKEAEGMAFSAGLGACSQRVLYDSNCPSFEIPDVVSGSYRHYAGAGPGDQDGCWWSVRIMGRVDMNVAWKHVESLFEAGSMVGLTYRQILDRVLDGESGEAAFEALVDRHGPMVIRLSFHSPRCA